ncbi:MAG TPA: serine protease [Candidatus Eisenbacteria bacterium]|jgi:S1-C subfamily serine protease|nr:serine protease [Candidatus Eisenbacteria bacterium]
MKTRGTTIFLSVLCCLLLSLTGCATVSGARHDLARYGENSDATYRIDVTSGHGSGVVVSAEGHILTCYHVVEDEATVTISINEGGPAVHVYTATVLATDRVNDMALLKIDRRFSAPAVLADMSELHPGDTLYNVGYPYDFGEMTGRGYIMRLHYSTSETSTPLRDMILADLPDGPGTSGSGVYLSSNGHLAGQMRMMIAVGRRGMPPMVVRALTPVNTIRRFLVANRVPLAHDDGSVEEYPPLPPTPVPAPTGSAHAAPSPPPAH